MMQSMNKKNPLIAACLFSLSPGADGAIQLFPAGRFDAPRGAMAGAGPWFIDAAVAAALIARVAQRANDIAVDYEHQTLSSVKNGQPAPAAGWLAPANLHWVDGKGLMAADPQWTAKAAAHIAAEEYRYLSPVFSYEPTTGRVLDLLHVALTNNPAIDGMDAVLLAAATAFNLNPSSQESFMDLKLLTLLGLKDGATPEEVLAATTALHTDRQQLTQQLADKDVAIAAASLTTPETAVAAITGLQAQLAALTAQVNDGQVEEMIAAAKAQGKLLPVQEPWARSLEKSALQAYLDVAQPVAALNAQQSSGRQLDANGVAVLTAEQIAVCSQLGLSHDEFKKTLAEEA